MMWGALVMVGVLLMATGIVLGKPRDPFEEILDEMVEDDSVRLDRLEARVEKQEEVIDRLERLFGQLDFQNQSVEEITRVTGMKKGEVLLLKRLLGE